MSTNTYYVEGLYYSTLTNLLSDGWPEDKQVDVIAPDGGIVGRPTIAALRAEYQDDSPASFFKKARVVAVANEGFAERVPAPGSGYQYACALITEDEPGWTPGHWYRHLHEAQAAARTYNRTAGHDQDTVLEVQVSSMRASRTQ